MKYETITYETGSQVIIRTDEDGKVWFVPLDPANSDYQAYLNPVEHLTEIPTE